MKKQVICLVFIFLLFTFSSCSQTSRGYLNPVNGEYIGQIIAGNMGSSNTYYGFGTNATTGNGQWQVMVQPSVGNTLHVSL